jgi:MFS family permease
MNLQPKEKLSDQEIQRGLRYIIGDGLATEAMAALTGGTFLVAMALLMGANNFQIGLLAALPAFTNTCQLISVSLVRRYNNRRSITVICALLARLPLLAIGSLPFLFSSSTTLEVLIFFLFFHYLFGAIAGASWNSWMKDLVPEKQLGAYFSQRTRITQMLNVALSILVALVLDYIKKYYPGYEVYAFGCMFLAGGIIGIIGVIILSKTSEPQGLPLKENILNLISHPLKDGNFRRLLLFNSSWVFAVNIATPFFTVFLLRSFGVPLSYVVILGIISQVSGILTIRLWGKLADRYSNKTVIAISAPLYIGCIIAWSFVGIFAYRTISIGLLLLIYVFTGVSTSGVNLSLTNIGLKLAPKEEAIVYLSTKNIITAFFSSIAPLIGGYLADFFTFRHLHVALEWSGPKVTKVFRLLEFHEWNFLFIIGGLLALVAMQFLVQVKERGEVDKEEVLRIMRFNMRSSIKDYFLVGHLIGWQQLWTIITNWFNNKDRKMLKEEK